MRSMSISWLLDSRANNSLKEMQQRRSWSSTHLP